LGYVDTIPQFTISIEQGNEKFAKFEVLEF
jgi:hypothetical protein